MNAASLRQVASWILLLAIIGKMAGIIREQTVYAIFFLGFVLFMITIQKKQMPLRTLLLFILPFVAIQYPIPIPATIPPLLRLGAQLMSWIGISVLLSLVVETVTMRMHKKGAAEEVPK